jgi:hypothetical protein
MRVLRFPVDYRASGLLLYAASLPLGRDAGAGADAARELMRFAWRSRATLAIAPLRELPNLGKQVRMNQPGRADGKHKETV